MQYRAKWYVYELIDPRNGKVFYVGKGKNQRIDDHEWEAKGTGTSHKCNKIRSIWADKLEIGKRKIAQFWDEEAAYECEAERIEEIGLDNLTNVLPGGIPVSHQRANIERYRPLTPEVAMTVIRRWPDWVAAWLTRPTPNSKLTAEVKGVRFATLYKVVMEGFVNWCIPQAWQTAISDPTNHLELQSLLQPWNITLVFDPPTA
jgi:hypothetical protein